MLTKEEEVGTGKKCARKRGGISEKTVKNWLFLYYNLHYGEKEIAKVANFMHGILYGYRF